MCIMSNKIPSPDPVQYWLPEGNIDVDWWVTLHVGLLTAPTGYRQPNSARPLASADSAFPLKIPPISCKSCSRPSLPHLALARHALLQIPPRRVVRGTTFPHVFLALATALRSLLPQNTQTGCHTSIYRPFGCMHHSLLPIRPSGVARPH